MILGGLKKISLIDYPGKVATVIFTRGCNFRCIYCHNPQLVYPEIYTPDIHEDEVFTFIRKRKKQIGGIVITGGEPTVHHDLPEFIEKLKIFELPIKLDTNGSNPGMLKKLLKNKLIDFVAMDIKSGFDRYNNLCGINVNTNNILDSINILNNSSIEIQYRITVLKNIHKTKDLISVKQLIDCIPVIQNFKYIQEINNSFLSAENEFQQEEINEFYDNLNS